MAVKINLVILFLACAACLPSLYAANWAEPDQQVLDNAKKAMDSSLSAYNEDPEAVTRRFNKQVGKLLEKEHLLERKMIEVDACATMNPIDRCWRCDPTWLQNRKRLAECARGFARGVTGGADGDFYLVTDPSDDDMVTPKPGTLRHAVTRNVPLWIVFERSMVITLRQELMINSNKTIDGRGAIVRIAFGSGLTVAQQQNVIIHNIRIHNIHIASGAFIRDTEDHFGLRTQSDGDAISLFTASRIWIDHVALARASDGLIDAIEGSTAITISNCKFNHHNDVMLLGAHDEYLQDQIMQVTIAFNRFGRGLIQRMPRCRLGFFHVVNNDYSQWEMYAIGGSAHPTIVSQGNRFRAAKNGRLKEVTHRDYAAEEEWRHWQWRSEGDVFLNGAYFVESGEPLQLSPLSNLTNKIDFQPGAFVDALTKDAGVLVCRPDFAC